MRKIFLTISVCVFFVQVDSYAQDVSFFQAEGKAFFDIKGLVPNSDVVFYSERGGGKFLKRVSLNEKGELLLSQPKNFRPAVVINPKHQNATRIPGNGKVYDLGEPEFTIDEIELKNCGDNNVLSWKAAGSSDHNISFEVMRSFDDRNYVTLTTIDAFADNQERGYFISDIVDKPGALYKIKVNNSRKGLRYETKVFAVESLDVMLFPSIASTEITVQTNFQDLGSKFSIVNQVGQIVSVGELKNNHSTIDVSGYSPGTYFLVVHSKASKHTTQFIKR